MVSQYLQCILMNLERKFRNFGKIIKRIVFFKKMKKIFKKTVPRLEKVEIFIWISDRNPVKLNSDHKTYCSANQWAGLYMTGASIMNDRDLRYE